MNFSLIWLEFATILLGLGILLIDLWIPPKHKRQLGFVAAGRLLVILLASFLYPDGLTQFAFGKTYVLDDLALFFKRFFLLAGILICIMAVDYADRIQTGIAEFY